MKLLVKYAIFFIVLHNTKHIIAQPIVDNAPWCPPGATWTYESFSAMSNLFYKFSYEKDTLINSIVVKKIVVDQIEFYNVYQSLGRTSRRVGIEFLYEKNDSIFWYDAIAEKFKFLYPFNPKIGDAIIVENSRAYCREDNSFPKVDTLYIDSIFSKTVSNRIFTTYTTDHNKNLQLGLIVSKIGCLNSPFPQINRTKCQSSRAEYGEFYLTLVCYADSIRGNLLFSNYSNELCHSITTNLPPSLINSKNNFEIYPNPSEKSISVFAYNQSVIIDQILIYGIDGHLILNLKLQKNNPIIDIHTLKQGIYIMKIKDTGNNYAVLKFIKK